MTEAHEFMEAAARERRRRLEPERMKTTSAALIKLGCKVSPGPDGFKSFTVIFPSGKRFHFWPYSGWFAGKPSGRGFAEMLKAGGLEIKDRGNGGTEEAPNPGR